MIVRGRTLERDLALRCEVCVIGSGGGGAVVARELAEAGRDVIVLEQGGYYTKEDFTQREDEMMPRLYEDMGQRTTDDGSVVILQGRNVGGSTVHNLCYCFRTPPAILDLWARRFGVRELGYADLEPSFERVEAMLKVKPIRPDEVNVLNDKVRQGCEKLGYRGLVARHNREHCIQSGFCMLGCSYDAKQSMLVTYIPAAVRAGARIYADCAAVRLEAAHGRVQGVEAVAIDEARRPRARVRVRAEVVVVAAGAINTPQLLLASGIPDPAAQIGRNLHLHPSVLVAGFYDEEIHGYRGIPQSYYVDHFIDLEKDPERGYILMPIFGYPVATAAQLPGFGAQHAAIMRDYHRMVGLLALLHDQSAGTVTLGRGGQPRIRYRLVPDDEQQLLEGMEHCAEVLFASGARRVLVPYEDPLWLRPGDDLRAIRRRRLHPNAMVIASTHPQSTCRMGEDPRRTVVNSWGRSHHVANLFVADMSVFPTSLGAPPQITTAALADRTARYVAAEWARLRA